MMSDCASTLQKLVPFRQAIYQQGLTKRRDAQWEAIDALIASGPLGSFPEISCSPLFRRQWSSLYAALEDGEQDTAWIRAFLLQQIPLRALHVFALDGTAWLRPTAPTLPERQYVYAPVHGVRGTPTAIGLPFSLLTWVAEPNGSWALPVDVERIASSQDAITIGVTQVQRLCAQRQDQLAQTLHVIVADRKYGTHRFLQPLRACNCGVLVRLRKNRVLYRAPGRYAGRGRPPQHGLPFAFKHAETWGPAHHCWEGEDAQWGNVAIQAWEHLHAREAADTSFMVLRIQVHLEHTHPPEPLWLAWQGPTQPLPLLWQAYQMRWCVEASIRVRKQHLHWTLPQFQSLEACDRWTMLVTLAQWVLYVARPIVRDSPLPWQSRQAQLTPGRVKQSMGALFLQIGSPARVSKPRGSPPGWMKGRQRTRPQRYLVVRKTKKPPGRRCRIS